MDPEGQSEAGLERLRIPEERRGGSRRGRGRLWAVLLAAAGLLLLLGLVRGALRPAEVPVAKALEPAGPEGQAILQASGYVTPRRRATVAAKITGRVAEMLVEEGMHVEAGQVLARLDDAEARRRLLAAEAEVRVARARLPEARAALALADAQFQRVSALHRSGFASDDDRDRARTAYDAARSQVAAAEESLKAAEAGREVARQDLENCTIRAPFAGIAVSKDAQVGEMVSPVSAGGGFTRTGIATVVDMESLEVEVDVNESFIARIHTGQRVEAALDAYPDWKIPASVRTVIPTADRQKATVKVRISFDRLDPRILPDMGVKVAFLGEAPPPGAPRPVALVPREAVFTREGKPSLFLLEGGRLRLREVRPGETRGMDVEILSGCAPGDTVVVGSQDRLKDGMRARPRR
ncbi:MAG: efflux RND transporter periplasmic adaptor subunit [Acidobacteriota bacterium]